MCSSDLKRRSEIAPSGCPTSPSTLPRRRHPRRPRRRALDARALYLSPGETLAARPPRHRSSSLIPAVFDLASPRRPSLQLPGELAVLVDLLSLSIALCFVLASMSTAVRRKPSSPVVLWRPFGHGAAHERLPMHVRVQHAQSRVPARPPPARLAGAEPPWVLLCL